MIRARHDFVKYFTSEPAAEVLAEIRRNKELRDIATKLDEFLEKWGYRCSGELMLTVPSYQENPASLIELLQAYVQIDGVSPVECLREQEQQRKTETARVRRQVARRKKFFSLPRPDKSILLRILLKCTHTSIALRERARLKQALLYSRCRRIVLEIGSQLVKLDRLGCVNDVFYLTYPELESLLAGSEIFPDHVKQVVELRKQAHAQACAMRPPDAFELAQGTYLSSDNASTLPVGNGEPQSTGLELTGVGACGGNVTARAAILNDISECRLLSPGDILVARQTDPGWGPVFFLIHGLVLERGGMLSHGAILAREYGIPTVVGVEGATQRIAHGQMLTVNGDRGVVQLAN